MLRPYRPADLASVANVFVAAWRHGFRGLVPDELLDVDPKDWADSKADELLEGYVFVAERAGKVIGFAWLRDAPGFATLDEVVELHALYTLPGESAGMALLSEAIETLEPRFSAMTLWSLDSNRAALEFYEGRGFQADGATRDVERAGSILPHSRLRRPLTVRSDVRRRPSIRVVPRAPDGSILLMEHRNPRLVHPSIWLAPGGMPESGESPEQTVRREFLEETGRRLIEPLELIWKRRHIWTDGDEPVESVESFYLAEVPRFEPTTHGFTPTELEVVAQFKWWRPAELEKTKAILVPAALRSPELLTVSGQVWVGR